MIDKILSLINVGQALVDKVFNRIEKNEAIIDGMTQQQLKQLQINQKEIHDAILARVDAANLDVNASDRYERKDTSDTEK